LGKIKILRPQKHLIFYGYGWDLKGKAPLICSTGCVLQTVKILAQWSNMLQN